MSDRRPVTVDGVAGVIGLAGRDLGTTGWLEVTQEMVDRFAAATGDHQWIHVDRERAQRESPFGGPVAHGFLTLSLAPRFLPQLVTVTGFAMGVNYGAEKVRFPAPVPVGSSVRAGAVVDEATEVPGGVQLRITLTVEVASGTKPACAATVLLRYYR
jgi:acyl dehydratase